MSIDIYNHSKQLEQATKFLDKTKITKKNKQIITKFQDYLLMMGISKSRILKYVYNLKKLAEWLNKDFDKANKEDIQGVVKEIRTKNYSVWTEHSYCIILKRFYKWLYSNDEEYPKEVSWLKNKLDKRRVKLPGEGDLLTEDEIKKVLEVTEHPRNKALISMLFESGCRIGELATLKLKHIVIDKQGILLTVSGKTGSRKIRIISSTPYLMNWLNIHPLKDDKEAPLWLKIDIGKKTRNSFLLHRSIAKILKTSFEKAGLKKRVYAHLFRHSRASIMANHLTEFQMNQYFGWIQGSDMPATYVHLSGRDMDNALLKFNGIEVGEERKNDSRLKPKICPRCDAINEHDSSYCKKCTAILDEKLLIEVEKENKVRGSADKIMAILMKDEEFKQMVVEKLGNI